ncbi:hypothetical protein H0H93_010130 [Arthromyces matolae]|nr:hypothetical protein H0H93_010130 [Arthromyces matolae]
MHVSKYKNRSLATTSFTTADEFDRENAGIRGELQRAPPRNHKEAKAKALSREGYRCAITGDPDLLVLKHGVKRMPTMINTQCAHIFPESLGLGLENPAKAEQVSNFWDILRTFGYAELRQELDGEGIYRLENVMTIDARCHEQFETLNLWLEETDVLNVYKLRGNRVWNLYGEVTQVTFDTDDPVNLPVPSPEYLRLHAACCRIARMSGAADYVEETWRDFEDMSVLSADGASADLLHFALESFSSDPNQVTAQ